MSIVMPGKGSLEPVAQLLIEPLPGKARRNVFGLAAAYRDDARGEDGGKRRHALKSAVAMPELIGLVAHRKPMVRRDNLAVCVNGAENDKIGADPLRSDLGDFKRSEVARPPLVGVSAAATSASVTPRNSAAKPGPTGTISIGDLHPCRMRCSSV